MSVKRTSPAETLNINYISIEDFIMQRILLVDDDIGIQEAVSQYFSLKSSYQIITAEDGEIALDQIKNNTPDFIILDILLPRINGLALLYDLRKIERAKKIPVIFISGRMIDEEFKKECLALGAVDYFEKPFQMSALLERVKSILQQD